MINKKNFFCRKIIFIFKVIFVVLVFTFFSNFFVNAQTYQNLKTDLVNSSVLKLLNIKEIPQTAEIFSQLKIEIDFDKLQKNNKDIISFLPSDKTRSFKNKKINVLINNQFLYDIKDENNPKTNLRLNLFSDYFNSKGPFVSLETISINKDFYLKISSLPKEVVSLYFFFLGIKPEDILDKWIKVDTEVSKYFLEDLEINLGDNTSTSLSISEDQKSKILQVLKEIKIFKILRKLPDKKISNQDVYHYKVIFDKNEIFKAVVQINEILENRKLTQREINQIKSGINNLFKVSGNLPADIWISKQNLIPYKYSLRYLLKDPYKLSTYGRGNLLLEFKNFNADFNIQPPSNFKNFEDILKDYMKSFNFSTENTTSSFQFQY
jgi:hypothetical protein